MSKMVASDAHMPRRGVPADAVAGTYLLVMRGPDGRPCCERFNDAAMYRGRLVALQHSCDEGFTIEEIAELLDT
jgi:hypothetical protein